MVKRKEIKCGDRLLCLGERTLIMGVVNVTPDSFSDGGQWHIPKRGIAQGVALAEAGADVLDIGGESTRPGSDAVSVADELERVLPVIRGLVKEGITFLSIDTRHAETARICLEEGVHWVNDVSAGTDDPLMLQTAKRADAFLLMHMRGKPKTMQKEAIVYEDVVLDVKRYLEERVEACAKADIEPDKILVDPGIGFGKLLEHNLALTRGLDQIRGQAAGVLYGPSRKRFLGELTGIEDAAKRDVPTLASLGVAVAAGADMVRVHNVEMANSFLKVIDAFHRGI